MSRSLIQGRRKSATPERLPDASRQIHWHPEAPEAGRLEQSHACADPAYRGPVHVRLNFICLLLQGEMHMQIGTEYHCLQPPSLAVVPENMLIAFHRVKDCRGYYVFFRSEHLSMTGSNGLAGDFPFFDVDADHVLSLTAESCATIGQSFGDIILESDRRSPEWQYLMHDYVHILLLRIRALSQDKWTGGGRRNSRSWNLAMQFRRLVERRFIDIHYVQEYAALLNVTPKHLGESVKEAFGRSPREMVQDMLLREAKALLKTTDMTVSQISSRLNFEDQSYFGRFIKLRTGLAPQQWRIAGKMY